MVEIKILKTDVVFSLVFVKNSKIHVCDIVFWKRKIIMANKDNHKSCRWYIKFDVNVFSNIKKNVAILHYKTDIVYTCCKQLSCTVLSIYPSPF